MKDAVDLALLHTVDRQNDDGGWAGFVWNLGSKQRGPLFDKPMGIPATFLERVRFLADAPLELQEPAIEGLTGRVLQGLGANGFGPASPEVQRAVKFLEERQMPDGSFWARWIVGYLAATASVVSGNVQYIAPSSGTSDTITYTVSDGHGGTANGTIAVTLTSSNAGSLNVISQTLSGSNPQLTFAGVAGVLYAVDHATSISGSWAEVGQFTFPSNAGTYVFTDTGTDGTSGTHFYRTRAVTP